MPVVPPSPVPLTGVLGAQRVPESVTLALVELLLSRAGAGVHPEGVHFLSGGGVEITPHPPSPGYRAPENRGAPPNETEDVYVVGTLFYELLSGRRLGQLPEREILHGAALDRALDELEDLHVSTRMLLKAMLAFRPEARVDARLALQELKRLDGEGPSLSDWMAETLFVVAPVPAHPPKKGGALRWVALAGCLGALFFFCAVGAALALWGLTNH